VPAKAFHGTEDYLLANNSPDIIGNIGFSRRKLWTTVKVKCKQLNNTVIFTLYLFGIFVGNIRLVLCHHMADSLLRVKALPFRALLLFNSLPNSHHLW